ncbi:NADH dehydrogenase [ubiquinone] 1 alpha subcomplex subunit 2 isoform X2 [Carlito syrichta]|uniref:NADH dehydrogenase [ubiquinone] 1 alpha subcomplex subunit 2 n=1 Tax=Carlito syrichta TaxID=1868482 RepID=A0A3Q0DEY6_CARSF|nr:NADH dehydrogenase [ubiquinone] 1 alpha subcomplex subunit 2 isoform X2 [Carlito syrichta]
MPALGRQPGCQVRSGVGRRAVSGRRGHDLELPGAWVNLCPQYARRSPRPRRDFIEKRYVELKKANPDLPILIRECSDVQPKLWVRYVSIVQSRYLVTSLSPQHLAKRRMSL